MKKVLSLLLTMILLIGVITIPAQAASGAKIKVDGEIVSLVAYNIKDNNYFKLRDIANVLKGTEAHFDVLWNAEVGAIELVPDTDYSTDEEITSEKFENPRIIKSNAKIYKDGNIVLLNAYNINDNTFFKLRDLADVIDFGVEWNAAEEIIEVNSATSYVHPAYYGDGLALNTETLSLLNKNKAYVDAHYECESQGYWENEYAYNKYQLTVAYETPVTPESAVIGLDIRLDNLLYNCPKSVSPEEIVALFDEYKTGVFEKDNVAYLTVNYCGYELTFWRSPDEAYFSDKNSNASISLDTPYISDGNDVIIDLPTNTGTGLPFTGSKDFNFLSGAGGWATIMTLNNDGTFTGSYHDSEMGDITKEHPNGSYYTCNFSGKFGNFKKIDDNAYSMELLEMYTEVTPGKEWIEDGVLYRAWTPYGLDEGKDFILYTPDAPTGSLSEEFMSWYGMSISFNIPAKLGRYGIWNTSADYGFFE